MPAACLRTNTLGVAVMRIPRRVSRLTSPYPKPAPLAGAAAAAVRRGGEPTACRPARLTRAITTCAHLPFLSPCLCMRGCTGWEMHVEDLPGAWQRPVIAEVRHTYRESRSQEAAVHMRPQGQSCAWQDGDDLLGSLAELRLQRG